jgi:hypothetical protein
LSFQSPDIKKASPALAKVVGKPEIGRPQVGWLFFEISFYARILKKRYI